MRNQTTEEKATLLYNNSFNLIEESFNLQPELQQVINDEIFGIMEYFGDKDVYMVDLPVISIPHPEPRRSMVDPALRGVPREMIIHMNSTPFNDIYGMVEHLNSLLEQNKEIFVYSIQYIQVYEPTSFEAIRKPILRYKTIDKDVWYTPSDRPPSTVTRTPPGRNGFHGEFYNRVEILRTSDIEEEVDKPEENIKIDKSINRHNFGDS